MTNLSMTLSIFFDLKLSTSLNFSFLLGCRFFRCPLLAASLIAAEFRTVRSEDTSCR